MKRLRWDFPHPERWQRKEHTTYQSSLLTSAFRKRDKNKRIGERILATDYSEKDSFQ